MSFHKPRSNDLNLCLIKNSLQLTSSPASIMSYLPDEIVVSILAYCVHPELVGVTGPKMNVLINVCQINQQWARIARQYFTNHYFLMETNRQDVIGIVSKTGPYCDVSGTWPPSFKMVLWNNIGPPWKMKRFWLPNTNIDLFNGLAQSSVFLAPSSNPYFKNLLPNSKSGKSAGLAQAMAQRLPKAVTPLRLELSSIYTVLMECIHHRHRDLTQFQPSFMMRCYRVLEDQGQALYDWSVRHTHRPYWMGCELITFFSRISQAKIAFQIDDWKVCLRKVEQANGGIGNLKYARGHSDAPHLSLLVAILNGARFECTSEDWHDRTRSWVAATEDLECHVKKLARMSTLDHTRLHKAATLFDQCLWPSTCLHIDIWMELEDEPDEPDEDSGWDIGFPPPDWANILG